jgi:uroporphyrinogen III methyltransferase/synthase
MSDNADKKGTVYLIGAGPGDPDLITVKGKALLESCDVVVYDNLVPDELVVSLPPETEKLYVGKRAGKPCLAQSEINELLVKLAEEGKNVARLKGSDPLIFGRGGEEAKCLKSKGIKFEIVPGVTSGIAAPTYCGIPPTDRQKSSFVLLLTGHKAKEKTYSSVDWDWAAQARNGIIVIYMGVAEIEKIVGRLLAAGMSPNMPAAAIERGTFPTQRIIECKLSELPARTRAGSIQAPAVFVIGEAVSLRPYLSWFEDKPLMGRRVMITRPAEQAQDMYRALRRLGAEVQAAPTVATVPYDDKDGWNEFMKIDRAEKWLAFSAGSAVRNFVRQFVERFGDIRRLGSYKIAALGNGTANILKKHHLTTDFIPSSPNIEDFARQLARKAEPQNSIVVRARGDKSDASLEELLREAGIKTLPLTVYRTVFTDWTDDFRDKIFAYPPSAVIFTSPSTVDGIYRNLTETQVRKLASLSTIVAMGEATKKRLRARGLSIAIQPKDHTIQALLDELIRHFRKK